MLWYIFFSMLWISYIEPRTLYTTVKPRSSYILESVSGLVHARVKSRTPYMLGRNSAMELLSQSLTALFIYLVI